MNNQALSSAKIVDENFRLNVEKQITKRNVLERSRKLTSPDVNTKGSIVDKAAESSANSGNPETGKISYTWGDNDKLTV